MCRVFVDKLTDSPILCSIFLFYQRKALDYLHRLTAHGPVIIIIVLNEHISKNILSTHTHGWPYRITQAGVSNI